VRPRRSGATWPVTVNVKEYEGTGAGLAIVEQSQPGDGDVMVIDSIDVRRGVERGLFAPLPEDQLPIEDMYPEVRLDQFTTADGQRYAITEKFGYNTISFNRDKVDVADMQTLRSLYARAAGLGMDFRDQVDARRIEVRPIASVGAATTRPTARSAQSWSC
jgi:spermidine/putrescine-binding protein